MSRQHRPQDGSQHLPPHQPGDHPQDPQASSAPDAGEGFALRARPQPVTRINRKLLLAAAVLLLLLIAGIVLIALKPPSLPTGRASDALIGVAQPSSDSLAKLPASYDGLRPQKKDAKNEETTAKGNGEAAAQGRTAAPARLDGLDEGERAEEARLARLAGQARQSPLFFHVAVKPAPAEGAATAPRSEPSSRTRAPFELSAAAGKGDDDTAGPAAGEGGRRLAFLKAAPEKEIYNQHALERPLTPYQLFAGTIIAASLISGLNSDLPGLVIAQVTENVYDTVSGRHLLIPQGSRLIGHYDNLVAFGQERALVVWQRIIRPDGSSLVIDNLPATDTGGYAGLADAVDLHTWKLLQGIALATVLGVGSQLALGSGGSGSDGDLVKALQQSVQTTSNRAGQRLVERNLNVQPTLSVRPGWPLRVIVHKDLVLAPYRAPDH
jgi:type IV secretion system protein VirB10